jgi:hypothetical protein
MTLGNHPASRKDNIVIQEIRDEILIYDLTKNKAVCLNPTSAEIWQECDGTKSVSEISRHLTQKLKLNISEDIVWLALHQFKKDNLLADNHGFVTPFDNLNRREIVKRIGFAAIVALPVISSVIAPAAVNAQSGGNCGPIGNCTFGQTSVCICLPISLPGSNINPDNCPCSTSGDCSGNCICDNPCTPDSCPPGAPCVTTVGDSAFGTCAGTCPPGNNVCSGGTQTPICIPGDTSNLNPDCCPCSNVEGCANCCNDGVCGPCIG